MTLDIGRTIRIIRQAKGLKLNSLARSAKVSVPYMSLVENGERQPSLSVIRRLAEALSVPSELLVLLAQPVDSALSTSDSRATDLADSIKRLARAEESLRAELGREVKDATKGPDPS